MRSYSHAATEALSIAPTGFAEGTVHAAAQAIAGSVVRALSAQGALVIVKESAGGEMLLGLEGILSAHARPPGPSFLLRTNQAEAAEWRQGDDGLWLTCTRPLSCGSLLFAARFSGRPTEPTAALIAVLTGGLDALCSAIEIRTDSGLRAASYEAALDRSELGILLLARDGALIFANRIAERLLHSGEYLRRKNRGVSARNLGDAVRLQIAIQHVCSTEDAREETPIVMLSREQPLRPLLVCVSSAEVGRDAAGDAGAILRIIDPERDVLQGLAPICLHYRLSPTETRLACQLAKGATLDAAATELRIKPQTARSYLKQIFLKTDTNRQSELVGVLLASTIRALPAGRFRII